MTEPPEDEGASIIPIEVLTREATFRRFAELVRRTDGPPDSVEAAALAVGSRSGTIRWRSVDDELAALVYDSDGDPELSEKVRARPGSFRRMSFEAPDLLLEVEVTLSRPRSLVCQIVPAQPAAFELRQASGAVTAETDSFGTFHVKSVPSGAVSMWCRPLAEQAASVATSWVRI